MSGRGRRRADVKRSRGPVILTLVAALAVVVTVAALIILPAGEDADPTARTAAASRPPSPSVTELDLSNLPIERSLSCAILEDDQLVEALSGAVDRREEYVDGDRVEVAPGLTDVVHEDGCVFGSGSAEARVWVFAAPVRTADAGALVSEGRRVRDCTFPSTTTSFGTPTLTSVCTVRSGDRDARTEVTLRGLFGDAWLSCRMSTPADGSSELVARRADRWCVHVATLLGARP